MVAVPEMLELLARFDTQKDPRGMQQRFFTFALFASREGLLGHSLEGVDRQQLYQAVRAGLKNEDGRARSHLDSVFHNLSDDEIKPLLPVILQAVVEPSPSGEMFADGMDKQNTLPCRDERLLTDLEACEFLRIRQRQLYSWRMQGVIPFIRIGRSFRYRQRDLDATLDRMTIGGNQPVAH